MATAAEVALRPKCSGAAAFVLAFNVASWLYSFLGLTVNNASMPEFSRVKDDADR